MKKIAVLRDSNCTDCKLSRSTHHDVCQMGFGTKKAKIMVVSKMPNSKKYQEMIERELTAAGLALDQVYFTAALKCINFEVNASRGDVKACAKYLQGEIDAVRPTHILCFGNEPLQALTGHSGITKYRGHVIDRNGISIIPTISPAATQRNPGQLIGWRADITFFANQVLGRETGVKVPPIFYVKTTPDFKRLKELLETADLISYDIETTGGDEFADGAAIVSLAGTLRHGKKITIFALPLDHPESPLRNNWRGALLALKPYLELIPKQIAHNGKFDARWLRQFGVVMQVTFDTMLGAHILDENRPKGLKPLATSIFGVPAWAISTKDLKDQPLAEVLEYNALDTYYTYLLYVLFREQMIEEPRVLRIFRFITTAANNKLIDAERRGIWVDRERLATRTNIAQRMRADIDSQIMEWVPDVEDTPSWPTKGRTTKPVDVNFNPSNFARWFLFEHLKLPVIRVGKEKDDGSEGDPSMAEDVMLELKGMHPVIDLLMERSKWQKYCSSFLDAYEEMADDNDRVHTTYKLAGTVTGRLSSGKVDEEKVTARANLRGVNIQQVPRDPFIRGLFGAPPGWAFVEADFSQVELRVVAFISRDRRMLYLYQTGQDIHRATAASVLGIPPDRVSKDDRKKAKAVNFGFVYGMGAPKFVSTAFEKYQAVFSLHEAQQVRKAFFQQFAGLQPWHARQRRLVNQFGRVQSPIGRVRHLPDIFSEEQGVRAEAERQAINSPVQSFASDMTMLSMILIEEKFARLGIKAHTVGTVHDALLFQVKEKHVARAMPVIKDTMENLPLEKKFGVYLDVPIVADLKIGRHWGDARELEAEEVYDWNGEIDG